MSVIVGKVKYVSQSSIESVLELIREWAIDQYCSERKLRFLISPNIASVNYAFGRKDLFDVTTKDILDANFEGTLLFTYEWEWAALWYFGMKYAGLNEPTCTGNLLAGGKIVESSSVNEKSSVLQP